jgi:hypothetical protein
MQLLRHLLRFVHGTHVAAALLMRQKTGAPDADPPNGQGNYLLNRKLQCYRLFISRT